MITETHRTQSSSSSTSSGSDSFRRKPCIVGHTNIIFLPHPKLVRETKNVIVITNELQSAISDASEPCQISKHSIRRNPLNDPTLQPSRISNLPPPNIHECAGQIQRRCNISTSAHHPTSAHQCSVTQHTRTRASACPQFQSTSSVSNVDTHASIKTCVH
jgi:hypothetical protein